jgi:ATP-dependent Lhr-like helicase
MEQEWCDRRLLARIHRLTIKRLRAEIQPVSVSDFCRFLVAWQRLGAEHWAEGADGLAAVLEQLDGYELPAAAWEPEVLAARVKDYDPQWLDRLCLTGRIGWGRLTPPPHYKSRPFAPLRTSPIALYLREHLAVWLELAAAELPGEFSTDTQRVLEILQGKGAVFFNELVRECGLLPSVVEQAVGELVAVGWMTADSFDGLRAMLVPSEKRPRFTSAAFAASARARRHKAVTSVEFAGRWSLLRRPLLRNSRLTDKAESRKQKAKINQSLLPSAPAGASETALESFAQVLLRRYGVVFRRLLEREPFAVSWYELGRVYRRLEARGEIRGGHFIGGVSGEQFARPEAIGLLRSVRKAALKGEWVAISGADPLNLVGILTPGARIPGTSANRILLRDGVPIAALEGGEVRRLEAGAGESDLEVERALKIGKLPLALRPYYA